MLEFILKIYKMKEPKIKQIESLIKNNELDKAILLLKKLCEKSPFEGQARLLDKAVCNFNEQVGQPTMSPQEADQKSSSLSVSILHLLRCFDNYILEPSNLTTNKELRQILRNKTVHFYETIYKWHQEEGLENFSQSFGIELGSGGFARKYSEYWDFRDIIKSPDEVSIDDIEMVAKSVITGCMGWSAKEKYMDKDNLLINAYNIFAFVDNATLEKKRFSPTTATTILTQKNDKLLKICYNLYPYKQIGGLITVLTLNQVKDSTQIYTPFLLELEECEDDYGLISHIRNGTLSIEKMEIHYSKSSNIKLHLTISNHTLIDQTFLIPNGQLFEYHQQDIGYQVLALNAEMNGTVMAAQKLTMDLYAISITPHLNPIPQNSGLISFYKLNENFNQQKKNANYSPKGIPKKQAYYWAKVRSYFFLMVPVKRQQQQNGLEINMSPPPYLSKSSAHRLLWKTETVFYVFTPLTMLVTTIALILGIIAIVNDYLPYFYDLYHRL